MSETKEPSHFQLSRLAFLQTATAGLGGVLMARAQSKVKGKLMSQDTQSAQNKPVAGLTERRERYRAAVRKARSWLTGNEREDGSYGPRASSLEDLATAGMCLGLMGCPDHVGRLLRYIQKNYFLEDGSFRQDTNDDIQSEYAYTPSWVVVSAHLNGYFDISMLAMANILRFQDAQSGGLFGHPKHQQAKAGVIGPAVTGVAATAALVTGHLEAARKMGDYFLHLIALQPDLQNRFYPFYDTRQGLVTQGAPELGPTYFGTFERKQPKQHYWLLGFFLAILSDLYLATRQKKYLDGALTMYEFSMGCQPDLYSNTLNHKFLWGCARLYRATGNPKHLETALRVADFLTDIQDPEGTWWHRDFVPTREQQGYGGTVDCTSQFCTWLIKLLQVL